MGFRCKPTLSNQVEKHGIKKILFNARLCYVGFQEITFAGHLTFNIFCSGALFFLIQNALRLLDKPHFLGRKYLGFNAFYIFKKMFSRFNLKKKSLWPHIGLTLASHWHHIVHLLTTDWSHIYHTFTPNNNHTSTTLWPHINVSQNWPNLDRLHCPKMTPHWPCRVLTNCVQGRKYSSICVWWWHCLEVS